MCRGITCIVLATDDLARARRRLMDELGATPTVAEEVVVEFRGADSAAGLGCQDAAGEALLFFAVEDAESVRRAWHERGVALVSAGRGRAPGRRTAAGRMPGRPAA
jgi:hypothetical protein